MVVDKTKQSLMDALTYCSLRTLPDVEDGESIWVQALAKVAKQDGSMSYVLIEKDGTTGDNKVVKDFGSISIIGKYLEYYPITYLLPEYVPEFKNNNKEPRIHYLNKNLGPNDYSQYTLKELNKMVITCAIKFQLQSMKHNK